MKRCWMMVVIGAVLLAVEAGAQMVGTVNFANGAKGVDAPVRLAASNEKLSGPDWEAELLYLAHGSFVPVKRVRFETNAMAGYFFGGSVGIEGSAPGEAGSFKIRFWNKAESVAESEVVSVILGGGKVPPANLAGLQATAVIGTVRLAIARAEPGAVLSWPKEFREMTVQSSVDLNNDWQPMNGMKATNATSVLLPVSASEERKFFRLGN